ncbi:MAG: NAD(P)-binding domain-containing protein, partial [Anaeroplasmataceae bacterium]|nr:NAD(P)-binding domain-containing protein [Anaeroplasmataceae bacterium]
MKISCIGGGAWGTTLAQVLSDNHHEVLVRDINPVFVDKINTEHTHPFFDTTIPHNIKATLSLEEAVEFSDIILLSVPTKVTRTVLKEINALLKAPALFINVSKGIEPETSYCVSQIVEEEITKEHFKGYVNLSGPSHAEELILRKLTALVAASKVEEDAKFVQDLFSNARYLRVYTSSDVIGVETSGAIKNAIAIVSGVACGMGLGENARAFLISRGVREIVLIVSA